MKKIILSVLALTIISCTAFATTGGSILTLTSEPTDIASNQAKELRYYKGSNLSILSLVAFGDSSIDTLTKQSGITKIHHIDKDTFSVLGLFVQETFTVYGE